MAEENQVDKSVAAAKSAPAPTPDPRKGSNVDMEGWNGEDLGFSVQVQPFASGADKSDLRAVADRIKGWSEFLLDGVKFEYSEENARALVSRFPHFAEQIREAK